MDEIQRKLKDVRHVMYELGDRCLESETRTIAKRLADRLGNIWFLISEERRANKPHEASKVTVDQVSVHANGNWGMKLSDGSQLAGRYEPGVGFHHLEKVYSSVESFQEFFGGPTSESHECPCVIASKPCQPNCTCVNPVMSNGCYCCARYGSEAQRKAAADVIVKAMTNVATN